MTQEEIVIKYLNKKGSITTYEAFTKLYITRLSAVIYNLKNLYGIEFDEEWIVKKNRYGRAVNFKKYILKKENRRIKMNNLLIFGLGMLCGMVALVILTFIYASLRVNNIDKK